MTELSAPLPAHQCPICGGPNACAPAQVGKFQTDCWCTRTRFPASLLARIPPQARGTACVCNACVTAALAQEESTQSDTAASRLSEG